MKIVPPAMPYSLTDLPEAKQALMLHEILSEAHVYAQDFTGIKIKAATISESKLEKVGMSGADLEKLVVKDCILTNCDLVATDFTESGWRDTSLTQTRCSGAQLQMSTLKNVTFTNCKLDLTNFRYSKLENILFKDCFFKRHRFLWRPT